MPSHDCVHMRHFYSFVSYKFQFHESAIYFQVHAANIWSIICTLCDKRKKPIQIEWMIDFSLEMCVCIDCVAKGGPNDGKIRF